MERFRRTMALCLCTAAFLLGSCLTTTEELDLNKDISLDMQLGPGGLSIPLGSLDTLYLDSLIKVDGANSVIKTLEGGMYGFYMDGKIEPFSTDFCNSDLDKVTIPEKSSTATVSIDAIDLDEINNNFAIVPSNFSTPTVPVQTFEGISFSIPQVNVDTQTVSFGLNYDIPSAVTRINKIWFGNDLGSRNGQKLTLDVDLSGVYALCSNPSIRIISLSVSFPDNFLLAKDEAFEKKYLPTGGITVKDNVLTINMAEGTGIQGLGKGNSTLPVSFYVKNADFSSYTNGKIEYNNSFAYSLSLSASGTADATSSVNFVVGVSFNPSLKMADIDVDTKEKEFEIPSGQLSSSFKVEGLDYVSRLNSILLDEDKSVLSVSISDLGIDPFKLGAASSVEITFPDIFEFRNECKSSDGETLGVWDGNKLKIYASKALGKDMELHVKSIAINKDVSADKTIDITDKVVSYQGKVVVDEAKGVNLAAVDILEPKVVTVKVGGSLKIKSVSGRFNPEIESIREGVSVDLDSDVDFLKDNKNQLKLNDPRITINLTSSITVPVILDMSLSSKDKEGSFLQKVVPDNGPIEIKACDISKDKRRTTLVICREIGSYPTGDDTVYVVMKDLPELLTQIPDSIILDLKASVDPSGDYSVDITRELSVSGDYEVTVPFSFDNVKIEYSDTIKDLGKDLEDIGDKIEEANLVLEATVKSTIPLGASLTATALDRKQKPVNDITVKPCNLDPGSETGSELPLKLDVTVKKGALKDLDAIVFTVTCRSAGAETAKLKKGQYLYIKNIVLNASDGVKIDLTETKEK